MHNDNLIKSHPHAINLLCMLRNNESLSWKPSFESKPPPARPFNVWIFEKLSLLAHFDHLDHKLPTSVHLTHHQPINNYVEEGTYHQRHYSVPPSSTLSHLPALGSSSLLRSRSHWMIEHINSDMRRIHTSSGLKVPNRQNPWHKVWLLHGCHALPKCKKKKNHSKGFCLVRSFVSVTNIVHAFLPFPSAK